MAWDRIRDSYDLVAGTYEARFLDELDGKPRDRELLDAFARSADDPIVEIGCGPGQVGAFVRERGRSVVGLDLSPEMARLAGGRLDAALVGDMRALPIADGAAGGLLAFYSLIHLQRWEVEGTLRELHRVLRPGGRALISAHEGEGDLQHEEFLGEPVPIAATLFGLDELAGACRAGGFEVTSAERRQPYETESTVRLYVSLQRPLD